MLNPWQLPPGITDLSPTQSDCLYRLSNQLISTYQQAGFAYIRPPIIEYANQSTAKQQAFVMPDVIDGMLLTVHSDITPQLSRIDNKYCTKDEVGRYCYVADILQTQSDDFYQSRNPIQAGVEIYGDQSQAADILVIELMKKSLQILGFSNQDLVLNIGHIAVYNTLFKQSQLERKFNQELQKILHYRCVEDLEHFFSKNPVPNVDDFMALLSLNGNRDTLLAAKKIYHSNIEVLQFIDSLEDLLNLLPNKDTIHIDLATLDDKPYHSGLVFAYYHHHFSKALVKGGRYDGLNDREATGFSLDLKFLNTKTEVDFG